MSRYFINEGTFESLDVGFRDTTINVLALPGGARLFVDREPLRADSTPEDLAAARSEHEAQRLAKFTVLAEREGHLGGVPTFEVAARFRDEMDLVYQRRRTHFVRQRYAVLGATRCAGLRGAMDRARRADSADGRRAGDPALPGAGVNPAGAGGTSIAMALYVSNELAFELPAGSFEDLTVHELEAPLPGGLAMGLLVARTPIPAGSGLAEVVRAHVAAEARRLPFHEVVAERERLVAGCPAIEVIARWTHTGRSHHAREVHLATAAGVRLTFSMTAPVAHQTACDAYLDRLIATLELGHR